VFGQQKIDSHLGRCVKRVSVARIIALFATRREGRRTAFVEDGLGRAETRGHNVEAWNVLGGDESSHDIVPIAAGDEPPVDAVLIATTASGPASELKATLD
jgi:hypothetical protein